MRFLILIILLRHFYYDIRKRVWDKSLTLNIKSEQNKLSDTQNSVLFAFLSNLSILKIYNKEFLKSKSFCPRLLGVFRFLIFIFVWQDQIQDDSCHS